MDRDVNEFKQSAIAHNLARAAQDKHYYPGEHRALITQLPQEIDKGRISPALAAELVIGSYPDYKDEYRTALVDLIAEKKLASAIGGLRPTFSLQRGVEELDKQLKAAMDIKNKTFLPTLASQLNHSGIFNDRKVSGTSVSRYEKDDQLRAEVGTNGSLVISGGDCNEWSLGAVYDVLSELHAKGTIKESIGLTKEEFVESFTLKPGEAAIRGAFGTVNASLKTSEQTCGLKLKLLSSNEMQVTPGAPPEVYVDKILLLAEALNINNPDLTRDNLTEIATGKLAGEDIYGLFKDLTYEDVAAPCGQGAQLLEDVHSKLMDVYKRERENNHKGLVGADGGMRGHTSVDIMREDHFHLIIPSASLNPDAVSKNFGAQANMHSVGRY